MANVSAKELMNILEEEEKKLNEQYRKCHRELMSSSDDHKKAAEAKCVRKWISGRLDEYYTIRYLIREAELVKSSRNCRSKGGA